MPMRPCLTCGRLSPASRCPKHNRLHPTNVNRNWAERQRRARAVAEHRTQHGDWCPGWHRPAHPSSDLTADHITPVAAGGHPHGPLQVLCRSCNSSKQATLG